MKVKERFDKFQELRSRIIEELASDESGLFRRAQNANNWFTPESSRQALEGIVEMLEPIAMENWLRTYQLSDQDSDKEIGLMLAGNIPAVGFHDLMCVLMSGKKAAIKLSQSDSVLMEWILSVLIRGEEGFSQQVSVEPLLKGKDAYIATGSDNSSRYFDYYFGKYPHIIRKNRTSVAVLTGKESSAEMKSLGYDIFSYFGLGCRNVSKLYVSDSAQIQTLLDELESFKHISDHHKYFNNYEYNKSLYLVNGVTHLDNGFLLVKEDDGLVSPISVVFYEEYENEADLKEKLLVNAEKIQCVVGKSDEFVDFGEAQKPAIDDYADGVDTMSFLTQL